MKKLIILFLFFSGILSAAPSVVHSNGGCSNVSPLTTTVNSNTGANLYLWVAAAYPIGTTITSVTHNSDAATLISSTENTVGLRILNTYGRVAPDSGSGLTVSVAFTGGDEYACVVAVILQDVNQTTPYDGESIFDPETFGTTATINVTSASGDFVIDALVLVGSGVEAFTVTAGASQTKIQDVFLTNELRLSVSTEAGAGTVTMSWDFSGASYPMSKGYNINIAAAGSGVPVKLVSSRRRRNQ